MPPDSEADLLKVEGLDLSFKTLDGPARVLRGVNLSVHLGERVALVGESGSGKSVTARAIMGLLPRRTTRASGSIRFTRHELLGDPQAVQALRGTAISMIFQDPTASLNPVFTIRDQFSRVVRRGSARLVQGAVEERMRQALLEVSIEDPARVLGSYAFQLSGGMNQRVMIAMALVNHPKLLIADEPGTALDVTVQAQTLRMMRRLSEVNFTSILFISHSFGVVRQFAQRIYVMYAGTIVEEGSVERIFGQPAHPYTRALLASVPRLTTRTMPAGIAGSAPDLRRPIVGCAFRPRCTLAIAECAGPVPMRPVGRDQRAACLKAV